MFERNLVFFIGQIKGLFGAIDAYLTLKIKQLILPGLIGGLIALSGLGGYLYGQNSMYRKYDGFYPMVVKLYDHMTFLERNQR